MNSVLIRYLLKGYLKTLFKVILFFYCFGIIINLFEEIEFFKNLNAPIFTPFILTNLFIPGMLLQLLPFMIFISAMKFILDLRNNRDLLTMKVFGFSNFRIFLILAITSFIFGWVALFFLNPITSAMSKYYEKTKANYSKDIDHLISFNKNGVWIKEILENGQRIISAAKYVDNELKDITIYNFDQKYNLEEKIFSKSANIKEKNWLLEDVSIMRLKDGLSQKQSFDYLEMESIYTYEKITNLYKNFDTLSFNDLLFNYDRLLSQGYNKIFLDQSFHSMLSMPFFLFIMTALASILIMSTLKRSNNFRLIIVGLITCVIIYYLKDLSLALGQTNRIPLTLAAWIPIIVISIFSSIGILQINEK